jgi:RNA polymerase sigma-70 factor (ECF subfamily)
MAQEGSQADDADLQRLIVQGDYRPALEGLVRRYQHRIIRYCVAMLGDVGAGEEVAQEVFLGAYHAMPRFRRAAALRTWLWAIARKQCLKALRDQHRRRRLAAVQHQAIVSGAHRAPPDPPEADPEVLLQQIRQGLERLAPAARTVLLLRYDTGLTLEEIAHIVGRSEASVRRQLAQALHHLREDIDGRPERPGAAGSG